MAEISDICWAFLFILIIKSDGCYSSRYSNITTMVTHVYKLDDIQEAFDTAMTAKEMIKVMIDLT